MGRKSEQQVLLTHVVGLTRDDSKFDAPVFLPSYAFRFLHKERSEALFDGASQQREIQYDESNVRVPDAGTSSGLFHAPVQRCRIHGAPARCSYHLLPHFFEQVLGGMSPPQNTSLTEADRRGYHARDPRTKGRSPNHRSQYSLCAIARSILVELCGGSHVSVRRVRVCHDNQKQCKECITPTSRKRTSRHSAPKSFIRFSANSRRFPEFSDPEVTSGRGMSLQMIR